MKRLRLLSLAPLALALVALGGCTSSTSKTADDFKGPQKDVAKAVDELASAAKKVDAGKICDSLVTADLKAQLTTLAKSSKRGTDCADQLKDSLTDSDSFDLDVQSIKISGTTAVVTIKTKTNAKDDPVDTITMTNQRGWRVSKIS